MEGLWLPLTLRPERWRDRNLCGLLMWKTELRRAFIVPKDGGSFQEAGQKLCEQCFGSEHVTCYMLWAPFILEDRKIL